MPNLVSFMWMYGMVKEYSSNFSPAHGPGWGRDFKFFLKKISNASDSRFSFTMPSLFIFTFNFYYGNRALIGTSKIRAKNPKICMQLCAEKSPKY